MNTQSFDAGKVVLCYDASTSTATCVLIETTCKISTGHPTMESFDDPLALVARVKELGLPIGETCSVWPAGKILHPVTHSSFINAPPQRLVDAPTWNADDTYPEGAWVRHKGELWFHTSDQQGEPDGTYDVAAWTGDWIPLSALR